MTAPYKRVYAEDAVGENRLRLKILENNLPTATAELVWANWSFSVDAGGGAADPTFTSVVAEYATLDGQNEGKNTIFARYRATILDPGDGSGGIWKVNLPVSTDEWGPDGYGYLIRSAAPISRYNCEYQSRGAGTSHATLVIPGIEPESAVTSIDEICAVRPDYPYVLAAGDKIGGSFVYKQAASE